MSKMGFISKHTSQGNGFIWDENRIKILRDRYLPEGGPSLLPSLSSQTSSHDSINETSETRASGKTTQLQELRNFKELVRLTTPIIDKCVVFGFQGRMDWQVTMSDGSWALLCGKCGLELTEKTWTALMMTKEVCCPQCGSKSLYKDGLRYLNDGSTVQRWLCKNCGYQFSDPDNMEDCKHSAVRNIQKIPTSSLKTPDGLPYGCQVGVAKARGVKN